MEKFTSSRKKSIEKRSNSKHNEFRNKKKNKIIDKIGCVCRGGEISFGKEKINQDNYFNYNFDDLIFIGVCDGHGDYGHFVSEFLKNNLPLKLSEIYTKEKDGQQFENISQQKMTQIVQDAFYTTDNELNKLCEEMKSKKIMGEINPNFFNCDYSGSTCVSLFSKKSDISNIYIANVGDSRAIIIKEKDNNWTYEQLSRDHKPTEEDEYKRIIDADGEIEAIEDDDGNWTGPLRVWEKGSEGPGLAMTRSLGDSVGAKIGVICIPEVFKFKVKEEDKLIVIASDGLWEYMSNKEVTDAVKELMIEMKKNGNLNADSIANELLKQSIQRWREKEQGMDDITIICILLK